MLKPVLVDSTVWLEQLPLQQPAPATGMLSNVVVELVFLTRVSAGTFDPADEEMCRLVGYGRGQHARYHIAT